MKPPHFLQSRDFWFGLALVLIAIVSVWLFATNRALINSQRRDLEKICNTTTTLDIALVNPLLLETKATIEDLPNGAYRRRIIAFRDNLLVAHEALSETQSCEPVR